MLRATKPFGAAGVPPCVTFCRKRSASNACLARAFALASPVAPTAKHSPAPYIAVQRPSLSESTRSADALSPGVRSGASAT